MMINLYSYYQHLINTGDALEFDSDTLLGWAIQGCTKQHVNHTAVAMRYQLCGTNVERRYISETRKLKGKTQVGLTYLSSKIQNHDGKVYLLRLKPKFEASRKDIGIKMQSLEGIEYDWWSLFKNIFIRPLVNADKLYCTEALQVALIRAGLLSEDFNNGRGLVPGQLLLTGLYEDPILIYSNK